MQIALVTAKPASFTPTNVGLAVNYQCTSCQTYADAYQWVVGVPAGADLTPEGRQRLDGVRKDLHDLGHSNLTASEIQREVPGLAAEVGSVLATEIEHSGEVEGRAKEEKQETQETTPGAPDRVSAEATTPPSTGDSVAP
jgi:hypothetical protein